MAVGNASSFVEANIYFFIFGGSYNNNNSKDPGHCKSCRK